RWRALAVAATEMVLLMETQMEVRVLVPPGVFKFVPVGNGLYRRVERNPVAAYDSKNGLGESVPRPKYTPAAAKRALEVLAPKLSRRDLAEAWRMIEQRIDWNAPRRGNGHAR